MTERARSSFAYTRKLYQTCRDRRPRLSKLVTVTAAHPPPVSSSSKTFLTDRSHRDPSLRSRMTRWEGRNVRKRSREGSRAEENAKNYIKSVGANCVRPRYRSRLTSHCCPKARLTLAFSCERACREATVEFSTKTSSGRQTELAECRLTDE